MRFERLDVKVFGHIRKAGLMPGFFKAFGHIGIRSCQLPSPEGGLALPHEEGALGWLTSALKRFSSSIY
jgi:hypothetical protein